MEDRLFRVEAKLDSVKEEVSELKADFKIHMAETKNHIEIIKEHVTGDGKIINAIEPLIQQMPSMVEIIQAYHFEKELKARRKESIWIWSKRLAIVSSIVGIAISVFKAFS